MLLPKQILWPFLLLAILPSICSAQPATIPFFDQYGKQGRPADFFNALREKRKVDSQGLPTSGSMYIDEAFRPCKIYFRDQFVGDFEYRHNAFNDEIEIRGPQAADTEVSSLSLNRYLRVEDQTTNRNIQVSTYQDENGAYRNGYLYGLQTTGKYQLYYKNNVKYTAGTRPANSLVRPTPNRFTHFRKYFAMQEGEAAAEAWISKKSDLINFLDKEDRARAKAYLKEERLSVKKEADLVQLLRYLNEEIPVQ